MWKRTTWGHYIDHMKRGIKVSFHDWLEQTSASPSYTTVLFKYEEWITTFRSMVCGVDRPEQGTRWRWKFAGAFRAGARTWLYFSVPPALAPSRQRMPWAGWGRQYLGCTDDLQMIYTCIQFHLHLHILWTIMTSKSDTHTIFTCVSWAKSKHVVCMLGETYVGV